MYKQTQENTRRFSSLSDFPRNLRWLALGLLPLLLLCVFETHGSAAETKAAMGPTAKRGEVIFQQHCVSCHNKQPGQSAPFGPPNLYGIFRGPGAITTRQAEQTIEHGKGAMPAWGAVLTHSDIDAVVAYLKAR